MEVSLKAMIFSFFLLSVVPSTVLAAESGEDEEPKTLQEALAKRAAESASKVPSERGAIMQSSIDNIRESGLEDNAPKVGDTLPDTKLVDVNGKEVVLSDLRGEKKAVITFYRGGWCPYCNLQLHYYQEALPQMKELGAELIAISPEMPDNSLSTSQKNNLEFAVLSDHQNHYARQLGLVFTLEPELVEVYKSFGINLEKVNGDDKWELPLSATFVVDKDGKVLYRFVEADYKKRAAVADILKAL